MPSRDQTIALAGILQAASLAQQLARRGNADDDAMQASVRSILALDADDAASVFGGIEGVMAGLLVIRNKLTNRFEAVELEMGRYALALYQLQGNLTRNRAMVSAIQSRVSELQAQCESLERLGPDVFSDLADLYKETISQLNPKIIVQGEQGYLANPQIADQVRAVLLAGVRAALLWSQLGGGRIHLLLQRKHYAFMAERLLAEVD
ncbi:MAG: high frequency lysogenization protein HflD [Gammaproteobacteria bacterium]|nr:high frequency lysogenization protein HflD [Gammaproteobacteria bacterium]